MSATSAHLTNRPHSNQPLLFCPPCVASSYDGGGGSDEVGDAAEATEDCGGQLVPSATGAVRADEDEEDEEEAGGGVAVALVAAVLVGTGAAALDCW